VHEGITDDVRKREEDYFRRKDRELLEKMRAAAAADQTRKDLGHATGIQDPALLQELESLGFTPETIALLPLVPVLQVAWAEGGISAAERKMIVDLARQRGIQAGSAGDVRLTEWLDTRPSEETFRKASRLIAAMLDQPVSTGPHLSADELIRYCEQIASASGGLFGIGKVSAEERAALEQIARGLKTRP
jgi:tellurite resistance protein